MEIIIRNTINQPIYEQISTQLKNQIIAGTLKPGEALPSIRALAKDLKISVITTKRAYEELEAQGFLNTIAGKGSFVAENSHIKDSKKAAVYKKQEEVATEACLLQVDKKRLYELIDQVYGRGGMCDD